MVIEKIIKYIPITTLIILFLFVCGGLYLIGFWETFRVDIIGLVQITEIPKSFILPFSYSIGITMLMLFISLLITEGKPIPVFFHKAFDYVLEIENKNIFFKLDFWVTVLSVSILVLSLFLNHSIVFWNISGLIMVAVIFSKLLSYSYLFKQFRNSKMILALCYIIVFTPIMSFVMGKTKALEIYNNREIKWIKTLSNANTKEIFAQNDTSALKFLGFLGDKFIISSLDNKKIIILNQSAFDGVELIEPPKP
jgi:hypothetical protein